MIRNSAISSARISDDIDALAQITEPDRPYTRRAFSPMFDKGREWLGNRFREAGFEVSVDAGGNLLGLLTGSQPELGTIVMGSHSDTVPDGGRFDGIAGVVTALEVARALQDSDIKLRHNFLAVDFLAEEVSVFGVSCIGSRAMSGILPANWLERHYEGRSLAQAMSDVGGNAGKLGAQLVNNPVAFLELHIEQGPVLENGPTEIGIVSAIAGITRVEITLTGRPDHAGTTPMRLRADALVAASELVGEIATQATELTKSGRHFTATTGEFEIFPGAANVVPGKVRMLVDIRSESEADLKIFLTWLENIQPRGEFRVQINRLSQNPPVPMDKRVVGLLKSTCENREASFLEMVSGAGHDAAFMARTCPTGMVFVPCKQGRSHCPEESAEMLDIARGADVLMNAVLELDKCVEDQDA